MDVAVWTRLSRLLDEALDVPASERVAWVASLGPEHDALKPRLLALLAHTPSLEGSGFLETLPTIGDGAGASEEGDESGDDSSARIGPYRLVREIGSGGMGTVWLAERSDGMIRRPVALKLPHGAWPRTTLAERMRRERDILAALTHPNIARLYDAGVTPRGRPYLALEYVEGRPIDDYCREHQLDARARIRVFLQVIQAVAYAHAQLVVHRDLKPSNILVTADGQVRLLDFGIAKLLEQGRTQQTALTELAGRPHTPEYASPEQITGEPLSTASDVYSLGVVLYELLTGARPYKPRQDSLAALHDAIVRADVPPPSTTTADPAVRRTLHGDLDTIVLKALKRAPAERYPTVNAFGEDLQRFLDGLPVVARPDSRIYRLKKFVARNRLASAALSAALIVIVAGSAVSIWQAYEARLQRNTAVREKLRADAQAAAANRAARIARANAELTDYLTADLAATRSQGDLEQQLERAITIVRAQYKDDPLLRLTLLLGIAGRYRQLGSFGRHRALVTELEATAPAAGELEVLAQLKCWRARDLSQGGNAAQARQLIDEVVTGLRNSNPPPTETLISCLADQSAIARLAGDSPRAIAAVEEVRRLEEAEGMVRTDGHTETLLLLSRAYSQAGRYRDAAQAAARGIELRNEIGRASTAGMINIQVIYATILREGGQPNRALSILAFELATSIGRGGLPGSMPALDYEIGLTLVRLGRAGEALTSLVRASSAARERSDATLIRASSVTRILALCDTGQLPEAHQLVAETEPLYTRLRAEQQYTARQFLFAGTHVALARAELDRASSFLTEARALLAKLNNETDPAWRVYHSYAAKLALEQRRFPDAEQSARAALHLSQLQAIDTEGSLSVAEDLLIHAQALAGVGETGRARDDAKRAMVHVSAIVGEKHPLYDRARALAF